MPSEHVGHRPSAHLFQGQAIALASLLMLTCGTALAQSSVQLYGLVDASLRYDHARNVSMVSLGSGLSRGSRLGWRSHESLGQCWKVSTMGEAGLNADDGQILASGAAAPGFGRQLWVGLGQAHVGTVALGRQYTPLFATAAGALDPLGANYLGAIPTTLALQGGMTARVSDAVSYSWGYGNAMDSPAPRDRLSVSALYAPQNGTSGRHAGFAIGYGDGTWFAGYAFHRVDSNPPTPSSERPRQDTQIIGTGYRWGRMQWLASLHRTTAPGVNRFNRSIGVATALPTGQLVLQVLQSQDHTGRNQDLDNVSLTLEHPMSAHTVAYVSYARNFNSAAFAVPLYQSPLSSTAPGSMPAALALGMRTSF